MTGPVPRTGILEIPLYVPGRSYIDGLDSVYKLSSNESALGASEKAITAYQEIAEKLQRYPDGSAIALREGIAKEHSAMGHVLETDRIMCGEGSDEIIQLLAAAYAGSEDEILHTEHGFVMYRIAALSVGATPKAVNEIAWTPNIDSIISAITDNTRIIFVANPNSTGTYLSRDELSRLHAAIPSKVLLVIDGAYAEYVPYDDYSPGIELSQAENNVVMTRTFSKAYGLAGLRLGWCYGPREVVDVLNRVRGPFNVTAPAQAAGLAAVRDQAFIEGARQHNELWRSWLEKELAILNIEYIPSVTNFICAHFPDKKRSAPLVIEHLMREGVLVRHMNAYGMPNHVRITIGLAEEMYIVARALRSFLE